MKTLTYLPVNWVNGLKLTNKEFRSVKCCQYRCFDTLYDIVSHGFCEMRVSID